jgi:ComF family protein
MRARESSSLLKSLASLPRLFFESLFPPSCFGCGALEDFLCTACRTRLEHLPSLSADTPEAFPESRGLVALDGLLAAGDYRLPILQKLIHAFKYRFLSSAGRPLAELMAHRVLASPLALPDLLVPVPLHPRRLRFRGFNQSEILARELARLMTPGASLIASAPLLIRTKRTLPQMKTRSRAERIENLAGAFALRVPGSALKGKTVWLVDDVATTGATLENAALALKSAGARRVYGIVVAK